MKMVMAVVPRHEAESVLSALISAGHTATFAESRGGMLRQAQYTLFIGVDEPALETVLDIIRESCHSHVRVDRGDPDPTVPLFGTSTTVSARVGGAVFATSANRSGGGEPRTAREVVEALGAEVDLVLDGGVTTGVPSTVVRVEGEGIEIIREAAITEEELRRTALERQGGRG